MSADTLLRLKSRCYYADPSYGPVGDANAFYVGRTQRSDRVTPVLYLHGPSADAASSQATRFQETFNAIAANSYPVAVPDTGSATQWATSDMVGASGFMDDVLTWISSDGALGTANTAADKVGLYGYLNGALNALVWAWNNPGKVRSLVLLAPVVDPGAFYTANPTLQASIDADWGTHGAFLAALPDIDPMQNLALIRPFAHRILCVYSPDDEFVDPDAVLAFAELVGAEALEVEGVSAMVANTAAEAAAMWTVRKMRERATAYVAWDEQDWDRYTQVASTLPAAPNNNTNELRTTDRYGAGRRGEFVRTAGTEGNERALFLLGEVSAPDVSVRHVWWNDNGVLHGQPGNLMRAHVDEDAGTYHTYIAWADIFFRIPWFVNRGKFLGPIGGALTLPPDNASGAIPGLRLNAGGAILASTRTANRTTITVLAEDADRNLRNDAIDIILPGINNTSTLGARREDANHISYPDTGADVASGGPGSWACFGAGYPYNAWTELRGQTMRGRFYPLGMDPPEWGDPDWTFDWVESDLATSYGGYGNPGIMCGHVGIDIANGSIEVPLQFGPGIYQEL